MVNFIAITFKDHDQRMQRQRERAGPAPLPTSHMTFPRLPLPGAATTPPLCVTVTADAADIDRWIVAHVWQPLERMASYAAAKGGGPAAGGVGVASTPKYAELGMDVRWAFGRRHDFSRPAALLSLAAPGGRCLLVKLLHLNATPPSLCSLLTSPSVLLCGLDLCAKVRRLIVDHWFGDPNLSVDGTGPMVVDVDELAGRRGYGTGLARMGQREMLTHVMGAGHVHWDSSLEEGSDWGALGLTELQARDAAEDVWLAYHAATILQPIIRGGRTFCGRLHRFVENEGAQSRLTPASIEAVIQSFQELSCARTGVLIAQYPPTHAHTGLAIAQPPPTYVLSTGLAISQPPARHTRHRTIRSPSGSQLHVIVTNEARIANRWVNRHAYEGAEVCLDNEGLPNSVRAAADLQSSVRGTHEDEWQTCDIIGMDAEWKPSRQAGERRNPVALLQLCSGKHCLIVQLLHVDEMPCALESILTCDTNLLAGVGVKRDADYLLQDHNLGVGGKESTETFRNSESAVFLDLNPLADKHRHPKGLANMLWSSLSLELGKDPDVQLSDWDVERLSDAQIEYAAHDAWASYAVACSLLRIPQ